jgi:CMP-N-acetylneuraminic acid synthetase
MANDFGNITAVIPVRECAGVKDNSLLEFGDVTLMEWKIMQLKRVLPPSRIVLSTNSRRAIEIAEPYGIAVVEREDASCRRGVPFPEAVAGIVGKVKAKDIAICPCTAPMLGPSILKRAFEKYDENRRKGTHMSLAAVNEMREYMWDGKKPLNYSCDASTPPANQLPTWYRVTNGLFMMGKELMQKRGYFLDENPCLFVVDNFSGMDIAYFDDYKIARELLSLYISSEAELR